MVICLERDADLHMAQLMPMPLTVSCFTKIQIGFTFLVPAHPGSPGKRAVKRVCVCVTFIAYWEFSVTMISKGHSWSTKKNMHFVILYKCWNCVSNIIPSLHFCWINLVSASCLWNTQTHLTALCPGLPRWAGTRKVKPIWILLKQETVSGSGISWAICISAPRSRQITTPAPHHSVFYRPDALPAAHQQCQSTEGISCLWKWKQKQATVCICLIKLVA